MDKNSDKYIEKLRYVGETLEECKIRIEKIRLRKGIALCRKKVVK